MINRIHFSLNRAAITIAEKIFINVAGNFYVSDKLTGTIVRQQQSFGDGCANGTNDKLVVF
jgi:hypothetical protein